MTESKDKSPKGNLTDKSPKAHSNDKSTKAESAVAPDEASGASPAPSRRSGVVSNLFSAAVAAYKTFAERAVGTSYASYPSLIDECLERCLLSARVVTGTGNQVLAEVSGADTILAPSIIGVNTATAGTSYQVSVVHNDEADTWTVLASPGLTWSVLVLYQRGKR